MRGCQRQIFGTELAILSSICDVVLRLESFTAMPMAASRPRVSPTCEEHTSNSSALAICRGEYAEEGLEYGFLTSSSAERPNSKRVRQAMSEDSSSVRYNLDVGLWSTLDDYLLEKIIARLSFKSFFRAASALSKTWKLRVHSPPFQRELQNSSSSWESYCPVFANSEKELVGYESGSKRWHRLPTHSYLPQDAGGVLRAAAGSLFCWTAPHPSTRPYPARFLNRRDPEHVHVTNPLTRSWKQLPFRPAMQFPTFVHIDLDGSTAYKVILGIITAMANSHRGRVCIRVQIFDSKDNSWSMEVYICTSIRVIRSLMESTFMNGFLYVLVGHIAGGRYGFALISLDVKNVVWSEIPLLFPAGNEDPGLRDQLFFNTTQFYKVFSSRVFVCGPHLMMAIHCRGEVSNRGVATDGIRVEACLNLCVFKLDVERGLAFEVSRAPKNLLHLIPSSRHFARAAAHDDCIYISSTYTGPSDRPLLVYYVGTRQWHQIPFPPNRSPPFRVMSRNAYRPGLNPLLKV